MNNILIKLQKNASIRDAIKKKVMERITSPEAVGGLTGLLGSLASATALPLVAKNSPKVTPEKVNEIAKRLGIEGKFNLDMSDTAAPLWRMDKNNATYTPGSRQVQTHSSTMNTAPILGHELGHAHIDNNPGLVKWLQDNAYAPTRHAGPLVQNPAIKYLTKNETRPMVGALKGGLTAGVANAGTLIPEFEASRRGIQALNQVEGGTAMQKLKNYGAMLPGMGSYLSGTVGSGAVQGYRQALENKKKVTM